MMDFKEFTRQVRQDLQTTLDAGFPGTRLEFNQVDKLQGESYTALTVTPSEKNIGMNINLDRLYDRVLKGESYDSVLQTAKDMANEMMNHTPQFKIPELTSYETAKDLLFVDVVGVQANAEMLQKVPHTRLEDIAMVYRLQIDTLTDGNASVLITNSILDSMGVSLEQLHEDALANSPRIHPASMRTMAEVMAEMMGIPAEEFPADLTGPQMFVVTTEDKTHGSAAAFYPDFMDQAAKQMETSTIFILPSSVHEMLFLPDDGTMTADELRHMVTSINADVVAPEDRLTDSVYHYDAETRTFELGESWEDRNFARDERSSVLGDLKDKQQNLGDRPKAAAHRAKNEPEL